MRNFNENTDLLGLDQLNVDIKDKILQVVNFISDEANQVTQEEKDRWNNKIDIFTGPTATQTDPGLMSAADKIKLDNIAELANFYVHPSTGVAPGQYTRVTVDSNGHVVDGAYEDSFGDAASLGGVEASKYALLTSPIFQGNPTLTNTPLDSDLDSVANVKFVRQYLDAVMSTTFNFTEQDIEKWNNKWDDTNAPLVSQETAGIMSSEDKTYLDNLKIKKILTQEEYDNLLSKFGADNLVLATEEATGLMSPEDKALLNKLTPASTITNENIQGWNAMSAGTVATTEANGLMSKEDKAKLDGIISISQESIDSWDAIAQGTEATTEAKGLMSAADKAKLDQVITITQDDINNWNNKSEQIDLATPESNGLMSAADKDKLDNLTISGETNTEKLDQLEDKINSITNATTEADGYMSKEDKTKLNNLDTLLDAKVNASDIFSNGYFQTKYNHNDGSYAMIWNESDGGGSMFFNKTLNVKSYVGVNQGSTADDIEAQIYSINPDSKIGTRLNINNQKGMYYLKGTTNIGMPEGRELAVQEDIDNKIKAAIFNNAKGYFETKYTHDDGSYAMIWNENDGGGSLFFNNTLKIKSFVGVNQGANDEDIEAQIYSINPDTKIGTRLNINNKKGMYYLKGTTNLGTPEGRELAVKEDITNALNSYSTTTDTNTTIDNKIKASLFNNTKGYFQTKYTHENGSYAMIWNEDDGGGSQFFNQPRNILSYVGVNQSSESDDIDVQIYAKDKTTNIGTRINFNTTGAYYTKNSKAIGNPAGREIAVKDDIDALIQTVSALEARVAALEA